MNWPDGKFGTILADPPWHFQSWSPKHQDRKAPYQTMSREEIKALPVPSICLPDTVLLLWMVWPQLEEALELIRAWGFTYKTCAFSWIKGDASQLELFRDDVDVQVGLGYWTRSNSEVCLLATRGNPKRLNADVRQAIVEPRREHSRKPDIYARIERLVAGPYCELFARTQRPGWTAWGNQTEMFAPTTQLSWDEMWSAPFDFSRLKNTPHNP